MLISFFKICFFLYCCIYLQIIEILASNSKLFISHETIILQTNHFLKFFLLNLNKFNQIEFVHVRVISLSIYIPTHDAITVVIKHFYTSFSESCWKFFEQNINYIQNSLLRVRRICNIDLTASTECESETIRCIQSNIAFKYKYLKTGKHIRIGYIVCFQLIATVHV